MFKCNTYIINPNYVQTDWEGLDETVQEVFIPITDEAAIRNIKDKIDAEYVYGVICLKYNDEVLFDVSDHDDVNYLWGYILTMIKEYLKDGYADLDFPSRARQVYIKKLDKEKLLFKLEERTVVVPEKQFMKVVAEQAKIFWNVYTKIFLEGENLYTGVYRQIELIKNAGCES